jgi:hypothetical protein
MGCAEEQGYKVDVDQVRGRRDLQMSETEVNELIDQFVRKLEPAQMASGFCWSESVKMNILKKEKHWSIGKSSEKCG